MKFKFLLLTASCLSVGMITSLQSVAQAITNPAPAADTRSCQQAAEAAKKAVVTLYSGLEIGAGSIVDADAANGTILTAYHVVKEAIAQPSKVKIYVKLANGSRYIGRVLGSDKRNDLALLQIPISTKETLSTVRLASTANPPAGQQVCAIGSPSGRVGKLDEGRFKALLGNGDLQSDLRLTYGNSGGPLLNSNGELIGVNKSIGLSEQGKNTGTSFATSAQVAQMLINKYKSSSSNVAKQPAVSVPLPPQTLPVAAIKPSPEVPQEQDLSDRLGATFDSSMTIQKVEVNSLAALWGLQPGDLITKIDDNLLTSLEQLKALLNGQSRTAQLTIKRNQQLKPLQVNF